MPLALANVQPDPPPPAHPARMISEQGGERTAGTSAHVPILASAVSDVRDRRTPSSQGDGDSHSLHQTI